jgi:hypothetical protein
VLRQCPRGRVRSAGPLAYAFGEMSGDLERDERLRRLFRAKHEGDTDFLIAALSHYGGDEVGLPATWLAQAGEKRAIPQLTRLLSASSPDARRSAAKALEELGPPESAKGRLVQLARDDPDAPARSWAIGALGKYRDQSMIPMIVAFSRTTIGASAMERQQPWRTSVIPPRSSLCDRPSGGSGGHHWVGTSTTLSTETRSRRFERGVQVGRKRRCFSDSVGG